ncbi:DMT family transporter [Streptomyces benahoarensis]|uniref:EamA family transporter n=1 Tax=Streptomyces benahoarensis TaxID=2595054 RepID=A0A553ZNP1_9ACTN|nr:EamA family transporter [Streptomyces benahoarensis]TSB26145.1 EamA family transporter [Streptomyces benahoarensis]TSB43091.1 EamA family transporter [Streptomyces benahoarensis]
MSTTASRATRVAAPPSPAASSPTGWRLHFAVLALIWGFSFLFIKVGTEGFAPLQVTLGRVACGATVLLVVLAVKRQRLPRSARTWAHLAVAALFLNALPFSLFAFAELTIPSTLAGICNATSPLWGMALSVVALSEDRPTRRRVAGLGVGFLGVLTVLGAWQGFTGTDLTGTAMALGASLCYPIGWIYVRRTLGGSQDSHLSVSSAQLLLATAQLAVVTPLFTSAPTAFPVWPVLSVIALGTLGTGIAFLLQYGLVAEIGPTTAQMVTYFIPVIATAAGVALLGEQLSWNTPVGALIVLAGAALTQSKPRRSTPSPVVASGPGRSATPPHSAERSGSVACANTSPTGPSAAPGTGAPAPVPHAALAGGTPDED